MTSSLYVAILRFNTLRSLIDLDLALWAPACGHAHFVRPAGAQGGRGGTE